MPSVLYDLSVPVYVRALENLLHVLKKGEEHAEQNAFEVNKLAQASLGHGMLPLTFQIQTASNAAKGILFRIGGAKNVVMEDNETTYTQLQERVQKTIDVLKTARPENFEGKEETEVVLPIPGRPVHFTGISYLQRYGLPNFFFHVSISYAILRKEGVPLGKYDYLGTM